MSWWGSKKEPEEEKSSEFGDISDYTMSSSDNTDFTSGMQSSATASPSTGQMSGYSLQQQLLVEQQNIEVQRVVTKMADVCFRKCVGKPSEKLSGKEQSCISNCARRYIDCQKYTMGRLAKQQQAAQPQF
eukprot:snap_masked-scaffold_55-processed-gene-1.28-mRNA-1 protein AED:0.18 eAED:0.23 QI:0/-1/0/1/-1/1/1/0/129